MGGFARKMVYLGALGLVAGAAAAETAPRLTQALDRFRRNCATSPGLRFLAQHQAWTPNEPQHSLEDLAGWLQAQPYIDSPFELVASFRNPRAGSWPRNRLLIGGSRSAQRSLVDPGDPRLLLYGNGLIFGITGHSNPDHRPDIDAGNNRVEVIQYDRVHAAYRFGLIDFNRRPPAVTEETSCQDCHGTPPRPIWQSLEFWDHLTRNNAGLHPLYRPHSVYALSSHPVVDEWIDALNFTTYLDHLNRQRIGAVLARSPGYPRFRYAALAAVLGCPDIASFLPPAVRQERDRQTGGWATVQRRTFDALAANYTRDYAFARDQLPEIEGRSIGATGIFSDRGELAGLRYLFEGRTPVPYQTLSLDSPPGEPSGYALGGSGSVPDLGARELLCDLLPDAVRADPQGLFSLLEAQLDNGPSPSAATEAQCADLRVKSLRAFDGPTSSPPRPLASEREGPARHGSVSNSTAAVKAGETR